MPWMKHAIVTMMRIALVWMSVIGVAACLLLAFVPFGCASSIETAPLRYREQHQNARHLLPDITVERLQACVEEYGSQLEPQSYRVEAKVQVDPEGRKQDVVVGGIPDSAGDLEACTRIALRDMALPGSLRQLHGEETIGLTKGQIVPRGNEIGNPIVLVELGSALAEFVAAHGGRVVIYAVTVEVLGGLAVVAVTQLSKKCRRVKAACIISCGDSELPTWDPGGNPFHKCMRECMEAAGCFYNP